jgi:hypothetical protein
MSVQEPAWILGETTADPAGTVLARGTRMTTKSLTLLLALPLAAALSCGRAAPRAERDIAVVAVELTPAPAGQPSDAQVTVANRGTRTLHAEDYLIQIEAPGTADELRHNAACAAQRIHVFMDPPQDIAPGHSEVITVHHIFARAGSQPLTIRASLATPEDGSTRDDALTVRRTVPPSPCRSLASR